MIEEIVLNYLSEKMTVPVYTENPEKPPASFIVLEKTGSATDVCIYSAMLAVQSYGQSLLEAALLNEQVKKVMRGLDDLDEIIKVQLNSDYNYTDTATKKYRYQAVYDVVHY